MYAYDLALPFLFIGYKYDPMKKVEPVMMIPLVMSLLLSSVNIESYYTFPDINFGGGYVYPQPQPTIIPPSLFDELATSLPDNLYLPPTPPFQDDFIQTVSPYLPPLNTPAPDIQPPVLNPISDDGIIIDAVPDYYLPPSHHLPTNHYSHSLTQLKIINMSCLDSTTGNYQFQMNIRSIRRMDFTLELEGTDKNDCIEVLANDVFRIKVDGKRVIECGIRRCLSSTRQNKLCATVRMATVKGLRLPEDNLATFQCTPQQSVVAHTKHLRLNPQPIKGRSAGKPVMIATGGTQRRLDMHISLLRRSSGSTDYDQLINPGSAVQLGEELLLRVNIKEGDGWSYSRMATVIMKSGSSQRSVIMVDENGCRTPAMKSICPHQPNHISSLIVVFPFRAFLFQGPSGGDDMLLSVRMLGCLNSQDCLQVRRCDDFDSQTQSKTRIIRAINTTTKYEELSQEITNLESELLFRVETSPNRKQLPKIMPSRGSLHPLLVLICTAIIFILLCMVFVIRKIFTI